MVKVEVTREAGKGRVDAEKGAIRIFRMSGHAGYAETGKDIICAAASVIIYTAAAALNQLCGTPENSADIKEGFFELTVPDFIGADAAYRAEVIMETAYIGFKQIESKHKKYLRVLEK